MASSLSQRPLEIAVLVETDNSWGRSIVQGVADFACEVRPLEPPDRSA